MKNPAELYTLKSKKTAQTMGSTSGLPEESYVVLKIYDLMGREIKTIVIGTENPGFKNVMWDSKDNNGRPVPSGMYFYRIDAVSKESDDEFHETKKMVLLK